MGATYGNSGVMLDPHTAIGYAVGRDRRRDPEVPLISLATAHPAKFPDAVEQATGTRPEPPPRLAALMNLPERFETLPNDIAVLKEHIRGGIGLKGAA